MSPDLLQARKLFLAEALELCQQIKEGLLLLNHASVSLVYQKLVRRVQILRQGAYRLELTDIRLFADGLASLLEICADPSIQENIVQELLNNFCDGLQLSLITHRSIADGASVSSQREFVLYSLVPKVLEGFETVTAQSFPGTLQTQLLLQQVQWIQLWSQALEIGELRTISAAMLDSFEVFPQAILGIAQVALAGFRVAYAAAQQRLAQTDSYSSVPDSSAFQRLLCPAEQSLETFKTAQYLVGLANQTIFCIASDSIQEIALFDSSQLCYEDGQALVLWRSYTLRLYQLSELWDLDELRSAPSAKSKTSPILLIMSHEAQNLAILMEIDRIIVEPELKLSPSPRTAMSHYCCYGSTHQEGSDLLVVDLNWLLRERLSSKPHIAMQDLWAQPTLEPSLETDFLAPLDFLGYQQAKPLESKTILIVDDSRSVREMLALTLQGANYNTLQAEDGRQALEHLQAQTEIHLIICDLEMSNLSGFEFLRHRLQDRQWLQIPVVILSSHTGDEYRQLSKKLGAADYFTIPYDPPALIEAITSLLSQLL
jgi:CheY-like chemotaxis protein